MRAQIHGLKARNKFNGMIVTLDAWNRDNQYFEARFEKTKATICIGVENVRPVQKESPFSTRATIYKLAAMRKSELMEISCSGGQKEETGEKRIKLGTSSELVLPDLLIS